MNSTRRRFLKTIAFGILGHELILGFPLRARAKAKKNDDGIEIQKGFKVLNSETQKSIEALAEALVPGTKEVGIKDTFMDYVSPNRGEAGFYDAGFWNLDGISKAKFDKPFYQLTNNEDKKALLNHVSVHNRVFFRRFQETIIKFYYSNPAVWKKLSYTGPPQPIGFMAYHLPPQKSGEKK